MKKLTMFQLQTLMANALDVAWKKTCEGERMISSFADVGLSLNVDGSEYQSMRFQGKEFGKLQGFDC